MTSKLSQELGLQDGRTYIISRKGSVFVEGQIYMDSPTISRPHAAMKIKNGRVFLRDLNSTNGIYLIEDDGLVKFDEGYINPNQPIMIGKVSCTIHSLVSISGVYAEPKLDEAAEAEEDDTQEIKIPTHKPFKSWM